MGAGAVRASRTAVVKAVHQEQRQQHAVVAAGAIHSAASFVLPGPPSLSPVLTVAGAVSGLTLTHNRIISDRILYYLGVNACNVVNFKFKQIGLEIQVRQLHVLQYLIKYNKP
mmetsp:Transcript_30477/g.56773  ORF Transcript_30477/g.56773 Transcript_30477/m.56773 type:complete len:113 (+) Transcript_30477:521-859(+)